MKKLFLTFILIGVYLLSAQVPTPIAWWSFDETSGTVLNDAIGTNDATKAGDLVVGSTTAKRGRALFFENNNSRAILTSAITQSVGSYSFWIRISSIPNDLILMANDGFFSRIFIGVGNNFKYETNTNGQETGVFNTFSTNVWYHIVVTRNGDNFSFYRNGSLLGNTSLSSAATLTVSVIGWVANSFRGYMDEVGVWDVVLDATDVSDLYNSGNPLVPPFSSLPTVTTNSVTNIVGSTALSGGNVTDDGGSAVTARGICWSTSTLPTTANSHTINDSGTGTFLGTLTGLATDESYYVRAYATNSTGTAYGNQQSFSTGTTTIMTDLVAFFQLNETSGDVIDVIGGVHGTVSGAIRTTSGYSGGAIDFDGIDDYVAITDDADWTVNTTDPFSVNLWFKWDGDLPLSGNGFGLLWGMDDGPTFSTKYISSGNYQLVWYCKGASAATSSTQTYTTGQWYQVTMVRDGTGDSVTFYRDGVKLSTTNNLTDINKDPTTTYIGGDQHSPPEVFNGKIDEVSIYRRLLTEDEIVFLNTHNYPYTSSSQPPGTVVNNIKVNGAYVQMANTKGGSRYIHRDPLNIITPGFYKYPLKLSLVSSHYIVDQENKPFFWSGDAAWSLTVQPTNEEIIQYLDNRKDKGFTVIMTLMGEHYWSDYAPNDNVYGESIFTGVAFQSAPNDAFFAHIDTIVMEAAKRNMVVLLGPVYLGYPSTEQGWDTEIAAASIGDMTSFGQYIGNRYKDYGNIMWLIGGDRDPSTPVDFRAKMNAFVSGLRQYDDHLITVHGPSESYGFTVYDEESWIDINNVYTRDKTIHTWYKTAYDYLPSMPFVHIEGAYENDAGHPFTDQEQRATMYTSIIQGGIGYTFGNIPLFAFGFPVDGMSDWVTAMDDVGSQNMDYFQVLFRSRSWHLLVPDNAHGTLTAGYGTYGNVNYVSAALTSDANTFIAYVPNSSTDVTIDLNDFNGDSVNVWWYNPATSEITLVSKYLSSGSRSFTSPTGDQVLLIDNAAAGLPTPGIRVYPTPDPPSEEVVILFAQNFETGIPLRADTLAKRWNFKNGGFFAASQAIINYGGYYGKVWQSTYHAGFGANQDGAVGSLVLNGDYDELYIEYDIWFDPGWLDAPINGTSGKAAWGMGGGRDPLYPTGHWILDSSAAGNGVIAHSVWGSGNPNGIRAYWYDQVADGQVNGMNSTGLTVNRGFWRHYTRRVKLNDRGRSNGVYEVYSDDVLVDQRSNIKWRSVAQYDAGVVNLNYLAMRYFFGGDQSFTSERNNIIYYDNIVAYYPTIHSATYPSGAAPVGHTLPRVGKAGNGLPNKDIPHVLFNESFNTATGTVKSHYTGSWDLPSYINSSNIYTKTITGHTNPIRIVVNRYLNGFNETGVDESWIKIYSGTGAGKNLIYYWQEAGDAGVGGVSNPGEPTVGATYTISATSCTIEFFPGNDNNGGFSFSWY